MKKSDLFVGVFLGLVVAILGTELFLIGFTRYNLFADLNIIKAEGILGKVITLGAIFNLIVFFVLLKFKKDLMARGIVLASFALAILTIFL